jgi:hypothetical protein
MRRASYVAQEAILKIKGEPVPVWYCVTSARRVRMAVARLPGG